MKKQLVIFMLLFVCVFVGIGCKNNADNGGSKTKDVQQVKITGKSQVALNAEIQLKATITPADAVTTITWFSSNEAVATVDGNGLVKGLTIGMSKITATAANGKAATKIIQVKEHVDEEYPDLGGYTIKIAHSDNRLYEYDPFYEDDKGVVYQGLDIEQAKEAWEWVENEFNCHMEVVSYPADAAWGSPRWNYIIDQARNNQTVYDFCVIEDAYLTQMVQGGALIDLTEWYDKYGNGIMAPDYKASGTYKGKLYTVHSGDSEVYNTCGVNLNLLETVQNAFPEKNIEEPAKLFNDGKWSFDTFYEYCKVFQECLDSLYNNQLETKQYYCLSGMTTYYWVGMIDSSGVGLADTVSMKVNLTGDIETEAGDLLYKMYEEGMIDPARQVDGKVQTWNQGHALFNTGEYWFFNDSLRWPSDLWGEGEATRYGYVPYPGKYADKTKYRFPVFGGQVLAMPNGKDYSGYGEECTAENIYYAWMTYLIRTKTNFKASEGYDRENNLITSFSRQLSSEESVKALVYLNLNTSDLAFYDPMCYENNPVAELYDSEMGHAVRDYIIHNGAATWTEAVEPYVDVLQKQLVNIYG